MSKNLDRNYAKEFVTYFQENPEMWDMYQRFGLEAAKTRKRFGIGMIAERIRWESMIHGTGEYKVQSNFRAFYARLLLWKYPLKFDGLFQFKRIPIDGEASLYDITEWDQDYWGQF